MSAVLKQQPIDELDFLYLCKEAVDLAKVEWQDREIIATRVAQIWLRHRDELSADADTIGGWFAVLEVPDAHIDTSEGTVPELWERLDYTVMLAIHNAETKPKIGKPSNSNQK